MIEFVFVIGILYVGLEIVSAVLDKHSLLKRIYFYFTGRREGEHIIKPDIKLNCEQTAIVNAMDERKIIIGVFYKNEGEHHANNVNQFLYDKEGNENIKFIGKIKEPDEVEHAVDLPYVTDDYIVKIEYESLNPCYYCTCLKIKDNKKIGEKKKQLFYFMKKRRLRCKPCVYNECKSQWVKKEQSVS